jgi:hypothetical protein
MDFRLIHRGRFKTNSTVMTPWPAIILWGCVVSSAWGQRSPTPDSAPPARAVGVDKTRLSIVGAAHAAAGVLLYREARAAWGTSNGRFHVKSDWTGDTLSQSDEISHFVAGYHLTKAFSGVWGWTGMRPQRARALGAAEAAALLTLVEVPLDAFNPQQGLGVADLAFDYIGVGLGLVAVSHPGRWDVKFSTKENPFRAQQHLFSQTSRDADNYVFWATYRLPLGPGRRQPLSVGLGHGVRRAADGQRAVRELYLGVGTTVPDVVRAVAPGAARHFEFLGAYYFNVRLRATAR